MEIIAQFTEILNSLNKELFILTSNFEPLLLNKKITKNIESLISDPELMESLIKSEQIISNLNFLITPIVNEAKYEAAKLRHKFKETPYASFIIDEAPVVKDSSTLPQEKQLSFEDILANSEKVIKPIKRRTDISFKGDCPNCGAPNEYIYENSKGKQYLCKCCDNLFSIKPLYHDEISHHCPHCDNKLFLHHDRKSYDVLVCPNNKCSFYLKNKRLKDESNADHLRTNTGSYKLRYTFRLFNFNLEDIKDNPSLNIQSLVSLSKIRHSNYALGLALTYYINYGLSSRKTSLILKEVHDIHISHQTVVNYAEAASSIVEQLNENYDYDLSNSLAADETYIKVKGKTNYVFFASDTERKIITSYRIFPNRDTLCAVKALYQSFKKYRDLPKNLTLVTDGNPIYNAAQVFFKLNDMTFDLYQVIGLKNKDKVSKEYRSYKQVEERLNRTYKQNYYGTNGYGTNRNANIYMILYVAYYNFLRKHSTLGFKVPITESKIDDHNLMPNKWLSLIEMSYQYLKVS
jgi:transposase-like protein